MKNGMKCSKARRMMDELLDGDLGEEERAELEAHLERCAACRNELQAIRKAIRYASEASRVEPGREQIERASAAIRSRIEVEGPRRFIFWPAPARIALGVFILALSVGSGLAVGAHYFPRVVIERVEVIVEKEKEVIKEVLVEVRVEGPVRVVYRRWRPAPTPTVPPEEPESIAPEQPEVTAPEEAPPPEDVEPVLPGEGEQAYAYLPPEDVETFLPLL